MIANLSQEGGPGGEDDESLPSPPTAGGETPCFWNEVCERLGKRRVGRDIIERWFRDGRILRVNEETVLVGLSNSMHVLWVDTYYRADLEAAMADVLGRETRVELEAMDAASPDQDETPPVISEEELAQLRQAARPAAAESSKNRVREANLHPAFTFETFVTGDNSQYCWASAKAVAKEPGQNYNPLLFYGKTGLGKTHLMTAIGHEVLKSNRGKKVLFVTGEEFTNDFIDALQAGALSSFRARYRRVDVLLIDDVQFLAGKDATQEEFFHTFNALINNRSQIVMTSDRAPGEIQRLEKRLLSRFHWGVYAEILPPGVETRIAILRQKAHDWGVDIDSTVLEFIATRIRANVRRLEGALRRLASFQSLYRGKVTVAQAEDYLRDILMEEGVNSIVSIAQVQKVVAAYFDVRVQDINGRRRTANLVRPRHFAMYMARELTGASLKEIGQAFGGRDHGTVINACKRVQEELDTRPDTSRILEFLQNQISH